MTQTLEKVEQEPQVDLLFVEEAVGRIGRTADKMIPILQAIQEHYHYLPEPALRKVCQLTEITPSAIVGVATFYSQFRHKPAGEHIIRVCHGTACHVKGSELVHDAINRHLNIPAEQDTDADGKFTIERVGCVGCCTLAPVVVIDTATYGHCAPDSVGNAVADFLVSGAGSQDGQSEQRQDKVEGDSVPEIRIGVGSCCIAGGSQKVRHALEQAVSRHGARVMVKPVGCVGMCHQTPLVEVVYKDRPSRLYAKVTEDQASAIVREHFPPRGLWRRLRGAVHTALDHLLTDETWQPVTRYSIDKRDGPVCDFLSRQKHLATEFCGDIDPLDLDEYMRYGGFGALRKVLGLEESHSGNGHNGQAGLTQLKVKAAAGSPGIVPEQIIQTITQAGLRGRGGAGFLSGRKWAAVRAAKGEKKYIVCNGDEGDPGAFMDRMILESYPYRELEGMTIAAIAVGARQGYLYIRAEYPLAVKRIRQAIARLEERNLLGDNILGSGYSLHLQVMEGAGAFVCGEETALLASIEGQRGMPRLRPPYPAESGLWGYPTLINNVETYALVPWIIRNGAEAFSNLGTATSKGTKVFALTGKVNRGGLIEVPMGITIRQIVQDIGGGCAEGRKFKAVQVGGPSGGCIPAELSDMPVDYESLTAAGAMMGSGGLVVLDDSDCMVDIARYFLNFTQAESCGKCTFCRVGTKMMLEILERLCEGKARPGDLEKMEELAQVTRRGSICGLGQTAPNPVLSTLRYFRHEYEAHLKGHCPAGKCKALIKYEVTNTCIGCTKCSQECPADAIPMVPYQIHKIDNAKCTRCDICRLVCPVDAIVIR